ncbi:MAG: D-lactate dehydrogenase [Smithella sp. PtaU1.Bin162]|nr:MAG: D-lactate dehydrogenase [Smithella sp. PtaU1.Bin162]
MDVFFYEAFAEEEKILREMMGNTITCDYTPQTIQEAGHVSPPASIISIRTQSVIPSAWAGKMEGLLSRTTGYDHLAAYLTTIPNALPCGYLTEYATRAVAEQAIMMMMALFRKLPRQMLQFPDFTRDNLTGVECAGKNVLVVGIGRIGSEIASIARAIGMNVKGVDLVERYISTSYIDKIEGIRWADVVICAMNLTKENTEYFTYDLLRQGKKGVMFINIARGEHARTADLLRLLQEGHLGAVGLDVFENEPAVAVSLRNPANPQTPEAAVIRKMLRRPDVICTPHNAFNTAEAVARKARFTVEQIQYFLKHKDFTTKLV